MPNAGPLEHAGQGFRNVDGRGAHQHGPPGPVVFGDFFDRGAVLLALRPEYEIVEVVARNGAIRGDRHHIHLVDFPELLGFRFGGACHAGKLVVHPEIILKRDGGVRLRRRLHLHLFLGLDRLVQPVGIPPPGKHPARMFVHDLHPPFLHNIFHVFLVQRVRLQQLLDGVQPLRPFGIQRIEFAFFRILFLGEQARVVHALVFLFLLVQRRIGPDVRLGLATALRIAPLYGRDLVAHVGKDEQVGVFSGRPRRERAALLRHFDGVLLLLEGEKQRFVHHRHMLRVILQVEEFRFAEQLRHARFLKQFLELLVAGKSAAGAQEGQAGVALHLGNRLAVAGFLRPIPFAQPPFRVGYEARHRLLLRVHQLPDDGLELCETAVVRLRNRSGNNERRARLVDQHGIHLVHDGEMMPALDQLLLLGHE